jgi:hypothetical protein
VCNIRCLHPTRTLSIGSTSMNSITRRKLFSPLLVPCTITAREEYTRASNSPKRGGFRVMTHVRLSVRADARQMRTFIHHTKTAFGTCRSILRPSPEQVNPVSFILSLSFLAVSFWACLTSPNAQQFFCIVVQIQDSSANLVGTQVCLLS